MPYYEDFSPTYPNWKGIRVSHVGWLGSVVPETAPPLAPLVDRLYEYNQLLVYSKPGLDACPICHDTAVRALRTSTFLGQASILIPHANGWYLSPNLILHYIEAHSFAPPSLFVDAVMVAPPAESVDYKLLLVGLFAADKNLHPGQAAWAIPYEETAKLMKLLKSRR